jgi:hypothetical protein
VFCRWSPCSWITSPASSSWMMLPLVLTEEGGEGARGREEARGCARGEKGRGAACVWQGRGGWAEARCGPRTNFLHVLHDAPQVEVLVEARDGGDALAAAGVGARDKRVRKGDSEKKEARGEGVEGAARSPADERMIGLPQ